MEVMYVKSVKRVLMESTQQVFKEVIPLSWWLAIECIPAVVNGIPILSTYSTTKEKWLYHLTKEKCQSIWRFCIVKQIAFSVGLLSFQEIQTTVV